jgi:hypothetical protein
MSATDARADRDLTSGKRSGSDLPPGTAHLAPRQWPDREGNDAARRRSFTEPGLTRLSFGVPNMAATCELVTAYGGQVIEGTTLEALAVMVRDPDGQLLELLPRR